MPTCSFVTFGCKINQYETQAIREEIIDLGYDERDEPVGTDLLLVNSCTVTERAGQKVEERVRNLAGKNPGATIIVTGCMTEDDRERLNRIPSVVHLIGNEEKHRVAEVLQGEPLLAKKPGRKSRDIFGLEVSGLAGRTRAFLKIQDGCDSFCSYCIIPYLRGSSRSRESGPVIEEARRLAAAGFRELVLTGIHLRQWGRDLGIEDGFAQLMRQLRQIDGIDRLRLSSIGEGAFTDSFLKAFEDDEGLCRFFHVPIQSGSDTVLDRMQRGYTVQQYVDAMTKVRTRLPKAIIATDVIVGFPGETEQDFEATLEVIEKLRFQKVHLFPYSPRPRTKAARLDGHLPPAIRQHRMQRARQLCDAVQDQEQLNRVGDQVRVLIESVEPQQKGFLAEGLSREGLRVVIQERDCDELSRGTEVAAIIQETRGSKLFALRVGAGSSDGGDTCPSR
ncbi:MAG: tRNA (N(6)-L-threonylcarbamoyladenosine(37)-C(2))-methylthiotransferase MtaB [Planctomycetota bacterium]|nr:tRNA (N(6)-L-threonylcarbamoyladenosine(37)-C(2))-methylthiotransferase MtaB [Planctomycetota bacterium]